VAKTLTKTKPAAAAVAGAMFNLKLRSQTLTKDDFGRILWQVNTQALAVPASKVAILICDMWDSHRCRAALVRVGEMAPKMNLVIKAARDKGAHIIHAPSDCVDFYADTPARKRILAAPHCQPPLLAPHDDPPKPIDDTHASDSDNDNVPVNGYPWSRQNEALEIDQERDTISANGHEVYNYMQQLGLTHYIIMGVHTNACILHRTYGIKQMVRWGIPSMLVRDMTDAMFNPSRVPYVSHEEGTRLVVEFIEKFWCPTISSEQLMK
jgi:nicotinamidase-related amidase